jgi:hypothetical protein
MGSLLARIRSLSRVTLAAIAGAVVVLFVVLVAVLGSPEDLIGLLGLAIYIVAILAASAAVTWIVIKVSPVQKKPKSAEPS